MIADARSGMTTTREKKMLHFFFKGGVSDLFRFRFEDARIGNSSVVPNRTHAKIFYSEVYKKQTVAG